MTRLIVVLKIEIANNGDIGHRSVRAAESRDDPRLRNPPLLLATSHIQSGSSYTLNHVDATRTPWKGYRE